MSDKTERLDELRIDRSASAVRGGSRAWVWPAAVVLVAGTIAAWLWLARAGAVSVRVDTARPPPAAGSAAGSEAAGGGTVLDASGYVTARRQATVSSETTGKVREVLIEEGMRVGAGQVLAHLEDDAQRAELALARARVDSARAELAEIGAQLRQARLERDRARKLAERQLVSQSELDAAEANFDTLEARLAAAGEDVKVAERSVAVAEEALDDTVIRAPFAGVVVTKNAQPGEMISPISAGGGFTRTGIGTVVDMDSLEIEVDVAESYIQRVRENQPVIATLDAYPEWRIPAEVIAIVPTADRQKATVKVRIGFLESDERILRDMGVNVSFLEERPAAAAGAEARQGVLVAREALRGSGDDSYVWLLAGDEVQRRSVKLGHGPEDPRQGRSVLVLEGLAAGDRVVTAATGELRAGLEVELER